MICARIICKNEAWHYHRIKGTFYCTDCAREIQAVENTRPNPIEIFKEFYQKPVAKPTAVV